MTPGQSPVPGIVPAVVGPDPESDEQIAPVLGDGAEDETARDVEDGVPVGRADAKADAERTGADEDAV